MNRATALLTVVAAACTVTAAATSGSPPELAMVNFNTPAGKLTTLKAGVTYQASAFPLPLRVTPPDSTWGGAQWTTSSHGAPAFGWVAVGHPPLDKPRGDIEIVTSFGPTPSVAGTIARLRTGGSGTTYEKPRPIRVAGFSGTQFSGEVWGKWGHVFIPFSGKTGGASPSDSYRLDRGEVFRIIALNVRGRTVVLFLESFALPAEEFTSFLAQATRILRTLRFSAARAR